MMSLPYDLNTPSPRHLYPVPVRGFAANCAVKEFEQTMVLVLRQRRESGVLVREVGVMKTGVKLEGRRNPLLRATSVPQALSFQVTRRVPCGAARRTGVSVIGELGG